MKTQTKALNVLHALCHQTSMDSDMLLIITECSKSRNQIRKIMYKNFKTKKYEVVRVETILGELERLIKQADNVRLQYSFLNCNINDIEELKSTISITDIKIKYLSEAKRHIYIVSYKFKNKGVEQYGYLNCYNIKLAISDLTDEDLQKLETFRLAISEINKDLKEITEKYDKLQFKLIRIKTDVNQYFNNFLYLDADKYSKE